MFALARSDFLDLLSSGPDEGLNFGSDPSDCRLLIIRMIAILIFTVQNVNREVENQSYAEILQRSVVLQNAFTAVFEFMGHILERCSQLNDVSSSYLLPGIMIFLEWLACRQDIAVGTELEERQADARSFFWKHCISFLNKLLLSGFVSVSQDGDDSCFYNMSRYDEGETTNRLALPEDIELRGFLPLHPAQVILDFARKHSFESNGGNKEKKARVERIIAAGKALTNVVKVEKQGIYFDGNLKRFVIGAEPQDLDEYSVSSTVEIPRLSCTAQENSVGSETTTKLQPSTQLYADGDDEDEVIVFKPYTSEKHADVVSSIPISEALLPRSDVITSIPTSEALLVRADVSNIDLGGRIAPVAASTDGFNLQNYSNVRSRSPISLPNVTTQYLQPIQPSNLNWPHEERSSVANGFANLNLLENGFSTNTELQDYSRVLQPAAFTVPFPQSIGLGAAKKYPVHVSESVIPSKLDSVMSLGASTDVLSVKPSSAMSVGLKKNPVSRPIRHLGPPPGFNSVQPKIADESLSGATVMETPAMVDDYRWLDGYQVPASAKPIGLNTSINELAQEYRPFSNSDNSMGVLSFPFPGKQVSTSQAQIENQNGWQGYQLSENFRPHQDQQQQLQHQRKSQQAAALGHQYQGQSLWDGRFFV